MQFSIHIDQTKVVEWHLSCSEAVLFSFLYSLPSWANQVIINGKAYFYITKSKIIDELPILTNKPDTVYRLIKGLKEKGLVDVVRQNNAMHIALTDTARTWNRGEVGALSAGSEKNPRVGKKSGQPRKKIRERSEINPNNLGNKSDISVYQGSVDQESGAAPSDKPLSAGGEDEPTADPVVESIPLNDRAEHPVTASQVSEYERLYPAVDVGQALRSMRGWCDANPKKRKTQSGVTAFINAWLAKDQNNGGNAPRGGTHGTNNPGHHGGVSSRSIHAWADAAREF